ncbi:MAG TPA: alpha/beta hydrolase family protein, partial [Sandaracinaceae bacterium]
MRWLDRAYLALSPPLGCFERGFGDPRALERPLDPAELAGTDVRPAALRWTRAWVYGDLRIQEGVFESPEERLPLESRTARVRLLSPRGGRAGALAVSLASWNDELFAARQRMLAPAVRAGVACLLLENAFYGSRRRVGQRGSRIASVSDFVLMGRATVRESHALVAWARAEGYPR